MQGDNARLQQELFMSIQRSTSASTLASGMREWRSVTGRMAILGIAALIAGCKGEAAVKTETVRPVKVAIVAAGMLLVQAVNKGTAARTSKGSALLVTRAGETPVVTVTL